MTLNRFLPKEDANIANNCIEKVLNIIGQQGNICWNHTTVLFHAWL